MPTFEFGVMQDVKVEAPNRWLAARALEAYQAKNPQEEVKVSLGQLGEVTISPAGTAPRVYARMDKRKAKKAPKECTALKEALDTLLKEPPPQSEVKDACAICNEDILPSQPIQEYSKGDFTYTAHSVCAAAGGAT